MSEAEKLAEVVGREVKRLRVEAGWTLEDIARWARYRGLKWSTARVVEFENGKIPLALGTLLIVCEALSRGNEVRQVRFSDLVPASGLVQINAEFSVESSIVKGILNGDEPNLTGEHRHEEMNELGRERGAMEQVAKDLMPKLANLGLKIRIEQEHGLAEKRLAKSLGINEVELVACEIALWNQSMSAERAQRADENATAQKLGRITRELKAEVVAYIESIRGSLNGND